MEEKTIQSSDPEMIDEVEATPETDTFAAVTDTAENDNLEENADTAKGEPTEEPAEPERPAETNEQIEVVSIKFRNRGKVYFFDPAGLTLNAGEAAIVETSKGLEIGDVMLGNHTVPANKVVQPLRPVVRVATDADKHTAEQGRQREREAFVICKKKINAHGLDMKLVDVEYSFEGNKILFFFSSDGRVDFRDLVKDLASVFRTRIELRQIGVRDEARMLGGLGICGRPFCCGTFMDDFQPVSTKMAKTQSMSLNPAKISGSCGRLMCCLRYEQSAYEELVKNVPKNGAFVETPNGYGNITQVNILRQFVKVKLDGDDTIRQYDAEDVAAIPGGRPRDGSQPPHILVLKPKKPKAEPDTDSKNWDMPEMLVSAGFETPEKAPESTEVPRKPASNNRRRSRKDGAPKEARDGQDAPRPQRPRPPKNAAEQDASAGEKREFSKPRPPKNRNRGPRPAQGAAQGASPAGSSTPQPQAKRPSKPPQRPETAESKAGNAPAGGEQKPRKPYKNNHRRYQSKPKNGGDAPKQGE